MIHHRVKHAWVGGVRTHVDHTRAAVVSEYFLPARSAIGCFEDSPVRRICPPGKRTPQHSNPQGIPAHNHDIGIVRVDHNRLNKEQVFQAGTPPGRTTVGRPVKPVPPRLLASSKVNDTRIGRRDGQCPDGSNSLLVKNRLPDLPAVRRLPGPATRSAKIIGTRITHHSGNSGHSARPKRTNQPPLQSREPPGIRFLSFGSRRKHNSEQNHGYTQLQKEATTAQSWLHPNPPAALFRSNQTRYTIKIEGECQPSAKLKGSLSRQELSIRLHDLENLVERHRDDFGSLKRYRAILTLLSGSTKLPNNISSFAHIVDEFVAAYRTIFILRDIEEMSTTDAADVLEITEDNVNGLPEGSWALGPRLP